MTALIERRAMHASEESEPLVDAPRGVLAAQLVLGIGGLCIGTGEFAAMGLLPGIADSMNVSIPTAGGLIVAYALGVVFGSPLVAIASARAERRQLLLILASLVVIGNVASAFAPGFAALAFARFLSGLPHGAYYGTASIVAAAMVTKSRRTQAIGGVMLGLAAANLIGVPLTTFLGQAFGWRVAFGALGCIAAIQAALLPFAVPRLPANEDASPARELSAFVQPQVWLTLGTAAIGFGGMFAVYSYITPTLTQLTGEPESHVPIFLALWGLGMVVGNVFGSKLADRSQTAAIVGMLLWNVAVLSLFMLAAQAPVPMAAVLFLIGIGFALVPALQARLMDVAPHATSLAAAMNHSAFNLSNAIGAWAGGLAIASGAGWASTGGVGAILAFGGLVIFAASVALERRPRIVQTAQPRRLGSSVGSTLSHSEEADLLAGCREGAN